MICVVLDGWHRGHVYTGPHPGPTLKLYRPRVETQCNCDSENFKAFKVRDNVNTYHLAFNSIDGKLALYTEKGDSEAILNGHGWVARMDAGVPFYREDVELKVDCQDDRAWPRAT